MALLVSSGLSLISRGEKYVLIACAEATAVDEELVVEERKLAVSEESLPGEGGPSRIVISHQGDNQSDFFSSFFVGGG